MNQTARGQGKPAAKSQSGCDSQSWNRKIDSSKWKAMIQADARRAYNQGVLW